MAIRNWHPGKLIILWSWGAVLAGLLLFAVVEISSDRFVLGSVLFVAALGVLASLSAVTWRWLSGKENPQREPPSAP